MSRETLTNNSKLLFIAATHGDEGFSIPVLKKLEKEYPKAGWQYDWIVGNPRALKQNKRFTEKDLNRSAPGNLKGLTYEDRQAARLMSKSKKFDMVVDIHGTLAPCEIVKIIPLPSLENLALTALFPDLINVIWYSTQSSTSGPLTQFTQRPSLEIECDKNDAQMEVKLYRSLVQALEIKQSLSWLNLLNSLSQQEWFQVVGAQEESEPLLKELQPLETPDGIRYPFLANQYRTPAAFLLKKIKIEELLLGY